MDWEDIDANQTLAGTAFSSAAATTTTTDFDHYYLSSPLSHISQTRHESGNKIIMPQSALDQLASLAVVYPMLFRIENTATGRHSHCGVVEFTADEGFVYLPTWMMNNMQLQQGDLVNIKNISLPKGEYVKLQPHTTKFTTLLDHKTLLENAFKDFACLTIGDTIVINHQGEKYMIDVLETKPSTAILLFETDCEVDFAPPLDYKEPEKKTTAVLKRKITRDEDWIIYSEDDEYNMKKVCKKFAGSGMRLSGDMVVDEKKPDDKKPDEKKPDDKKSETKPKLGFKPFIGVARRVDGQLLVAEEMVPQDQIKNMQVDTKKINDEGFKAFTGKSYRLL